MSNDAPTGIGSAVWQPTLDDAEQARLTALLDSMAMDPFLRRVAVRSIELMALKPGDRVLDVGCGPGTLLGPLARLVAPDGHVTGLDYSPALLATARERVTSEGLSASVSLVEGDATALPFDDDSFDALHVERVLMHLDDPDRALREMRRVVRPGGVVVAAEPDPAGLRMDHPADPVAMAMIAARDAGSFRNPDIGLQLNRRFASAGLVDRIVEPLTEWDRDYHPISADSDRRAAAELVTEGLLSAERAEAAIQYLVGAAERGEYSMFATMVIAAGRVPAEHA